MHSPFFALLILAIFALAGVYGFTELGEHMREQVLDEMWDVTERNGAGIGRTTRQAIAEPKSKTAVRSVTSPVGGPVAASSFPTATGHAGTTRVVKTMEGLPREILDRTTRGTV